MPEPVVELQIDNQIARITLNRPEVHNAVDVQVMAALEKILSKIEADENIRAIILTGSGDETFCAGGDIRYFATLDTREACLAMSRRMQAILERFSKGSRPVIAAVNGNAFGGGCEMLTACHIRIAATHATFSFRQAPNGIITGWGGGRRLLHQIGRSAALRLFLSGEIIDGAVALRIGLIDQLVTPEMLLDACRALAQQIAANSRNAVRGFLELAAQLDQRDQEAVAHFETERFADLWMGPDFRRFVNRFLQRE
ncbi:MAG: enoyl-CoA hydratase/isomerase family protein [Calditrichaeota bacterium]|nr:enoyl-CoA hydratase/isomerase family protein [Calditrichota bacterium]